VILCGITLPTAQASFSDQPFRMVERWKCIRQVVHTLIHACRTYSQIEARLIGEGSARASCEQLVHQAGLPDRINFHRRIPPEQVQPLRQRSQAILLMSDFEGLPVAPLQAMAAGVVPVVLAIESGIPELVHHERTELLVVNDSSETAAELVRLSRDRSLGQRCSTQSRALAKAGYRGRTVLGAGTRGDGETATPCTPAILVQHH
jgi:glycosyltransferase involved in cell wall biosynthesis